MQATGLVAGKSVGRIGFGPMRCSYEPLPGRATAVQAIHAALDAGATLIDTADCYAPSALQMHHNEVLIRDALGQRRSIESSLLIATKVGHVRTAQAVWERNGTPEHLRAACEQSLRALGVDCIGLLQLHSPDPAVPFEDQIGMLMQLRTEGKAAAIGLCNVGRKHLAAARALTPIASVQNRYSMVSRESEAMLRYCEVEGIPFLAWGPLEGIGTDKAVSVSRIGAVRGISPQQVGLAWLVARSPALYPLVGATRPKTAKDSMGAAALALTASESAEIDTELQSVAA